MENKDGIVYLGELYDAVKIAKEYCISKRRYWHNDTGQWRYENRKNALLILRYGIFGTYNKTITMVSTNLEKYAFWSCPARTDREFITLVELKTLYEWLISIDADKVKNCFIELEFRYADHTKTLIFEVIYPKLKIQSRFLCGDTLEYPYNAFVNFPEYLRNK